MLWVSAVDPVLVIVKVRLLPSVADTLLMIKLGPASLLLMVPTPCESAMVAPLVAPDRLRFTVSLFS